MVKKSEINKKGRLAKSTLSVVLAASMVLTSSSFVWAAPVEDIAIVEEGDVAVEEAVGTVNVETETTAEVQVLDEEENVGAAIKYEFINAGFTIENNIFTPSNQESTVRAAIWEELGRTKLDRKIGGVVEENPVAVTSYIADTKGYDVYITNLDTEVETKITKQDEIPVSVGRYSIKVIGNGQVVDRGNNSLTTAIGSTEALYVIRGSLTAQAEWAFAAISYTGNECKPTLNSLTVDGVPLTSNEYEILGYYENINACAKYEAAYALVTYKGAYERRPDEKLYFQITKAAINNDKTVKTTVTPSVYNGKTQTPDVKVEFTPVGSSNTTVLKQGIDYTVSVVGDAKNADTYDVTIQGINNFRASVTGEFKINKADFNSKTVTVTTSTVASNGKGNLQDAPVVTVRDIKSGAIIDPNNYTVQYEETTNVYGNKPVAKDIGTYSIKIVAKALSNNIYNYNTGGYVLSSYEVADPEDSLAAYIATSELVLKDAVGKKYTYDPKGNSPEYIKINGDQYNADGTTSENLSPAGSRFKVEIPKKEDCKNVGTYEIKVTAVDSGRWKGQSTTISFDIVQKELDDTLGNVVAEISRTSAGDLTYSFVGFHPYNPAPTSYDDKYQLEEGVDYDVALRSLPDGEYRLDVTFKGNYVGTYSSNKATPIETVNLNSKNITAVVVGDYIYNGKSHRPSGANVVITETNGSTSTVLKENTDYKIGEYGENVDIGKGWIKINSATNSYYTGERYIQFDIKESGSEKDNYTLDKTNLKEIYETGTSFNPAGDIKVKTTSGKTLVQNSDYTVTYYRDGKETKDYNSAGNVTMEIMIKATQTKLTASYRVATELDKVADIPATIADQDYTGSAITPEINLVKKGTAIALTKDKDYTVSYAYNTLVGTATVTIEGIGDYYGTYTRTFKIVGQMPQNFEFLTAQARDIKKRTLASNATTVKYNKGQEPKTAVTYSSSDEKVFTVDPTSGAIKYTGVGTATLTATAVESDIYKAETKTMTVRVTPRTPSKVSVTSASSKRITVKAAEVKEAAYYQIKIWKEGREPVYVNVKNAGDLSSVYTTKSAGTFHVQVRTFMYPGSKVADNYKSPFSSTHTVIVKK